ncbi:MAG: PaaX family transcriptional regulator [Deltaproteobacteria bacterium]|nr:PaaX family transcriptional regulator [Deltaproteobacteria bacterium]
MSKPTAKSLTLDLLSSLRGAAMPVAALIAAARLFRIDENALRVAITRLLAAGQIVRDERGQYRLGEAAHAIDQRVLGWRAAELRITKWAGGWWMVRAGTLAPARSHERRQRQRALALLGFAELAPGIALRPDNLRASLAELRGELRELGLERDAMVALVRELDAESDARARALWKREKLAASYRRSLAELLASEARLAALPEERAMVESFLLGGRVIRELVLDPLLPEPLAPEAERRAVVAAMRGYDRAGKRAWASFMARYGAPHVSAPAHGERTLSLAIA